MIRGGAALLVLIGHVRAFQFRNYVELGAHSSVLTKAFYFLAGFGHQAVIVFFALSGFLVGGQALDGVLRGAFGWRRYLARRLTRLWVVIIPALALTLLFDLSGAASTGGAPSRFLRRPRAISFWASRSRRACLCSPPCPNSDPGIRRSPSRAPKYPIRCI